MRGETGNLLPSIYSSLFWEKLVRISPNTRIMPDTLAFTHELRAQYVCWQEKRKQRQQQQQQQECRAEDLPWKRGTKEGIKSLKCLIMRDGIAVGSKEGKCFLFPHFPTSLNSTEKSVRCVSSGGRGGNDSQSACEYAT